MFIDVALLEQALSELPEYAWAEWTVREIADWLFEYMVKNE
jgi:hypothetical protein